MEGGGGFGGVHAATCTEEDRPYHGELLGVRFARHPDHQPGRALIEDRGHPATAHLPAVREFTDEGYDFRSSPRGSARVLAAADESSYEGGGMGDDHPLVRCREQGAGRDFHTALGHASEAYADPVFRAHLPGGVRQFPPGARLAQPGGR